MHGNFYLVFGFLFYLSMIALFLRIKSDPIHLFSEKNLFRGILVLSATLILSIYFGIIPAIIFYFSFYLINELVVILFGVDLFYNKDSITRLFYTLPDCDIDQSNSIFNKSEACYDTPEMTPEEANECRYEKIIAILGLKPNDRVLDFGCGEGTFVSYCNKKGMKAVGVTIASGQAERAKQKGLDVRQGSYHDFFQEFENQFDAVTFMGCLEHACENGHHPSAFPKMELIYTQIFEHVKRYLDKKSKIRKIFTSALHITSRYQKTIPALILSRAYGGGYPLDAEGSRVHEFIKGNVLYFQEHTIAYYWATVNDAKHFGHTRNGNLLSFLKALLLAPIYPLILYILAYDYWGIWMWQFSGKPHVKRDYFFVENRQNRPTVLYWAATQVESK